MGFWFTCVRSKTTGRIQLRTNQLRARSAARWHCQAEFSGNDTSRGWKVSYLRDPVGDPVEITDARGNSFTNAFYDTGELQGTTRPSWWGLDWGPGQDNPRAGERFAGGAADTDVLVPPGGPEITERPGASANTEAGGLVPSLPEAGIEGNFAEVARETLPDFLPAAGLTTIEVDDELRLTAVEHTDPEGPGDGITAYGTIDYDPAGRISEKSWPFDGDERITHSFDYDPHGNFTEIPYPPATASRS